MLGPPVAYSDTKIMLVDTTDNLAPEACSRWGSNGFQRACFGDVVDMRIVRDQICCFLTYPYN